MKCNRPFCGQTLFLLAAGWFLLSLFVGETELLEDLPRLATPSIIAGLTLLLLGSYAFSAAFRARIDGWSDKVLVSLHLTRLVGIYFLVLGAEGELDPRFAFPAGVGDIVIAAGALILLALPGSRWALLVWNGLGLLDILFVVGRAASLRWAEPESMAPLTHLPLSFLPTMLVPLIIASHVIIFLRCAKPKELISAPGPEALPAS